jgi:1,5-anhydro-D-fructose reductase (1,5-anhydro-D-mannitol-forming)
MKTIRWASIGCGNVCEVKSLPAMYKLPFSELKGVYARNREKAADFIKRHGLPKVYASVEELLADDEVDIVYIATPPSTHKPYALAALSAGKHVYVEKPMALNYAESLEMHLHAQNCRRKLFVAHYRRSLPYFQKVRSLLQEGAIGKLVAIRLEHYKAPQASDTDTANLPWRLQGGIAGGGYFYDLAPHAVDILAFIVNDAYADVNGFATNRGGWYDVEDTVVASFKLSGGVGGTAQWSFATSLKSETDTLTFVGTQGELVCAVFSFQPILLKTAAGISQITTAHPDHIQMPLVKTIIDELNGAGTCPSSSEVALNTAWAMDRMVGRL